MRTITAALALGVVLSGCTAQPAPEEERDGPGPLSVIAESGGLEGEDAAGVIAAITIQEEAIAACMHEAGFDYAPQVPQADQIEFLPEAPFPRGSIAFAEQYGYGLWQPPPDDGGITWSGGGDPWAVLSTMSQTERDAYETALWGPIIAENSGGSITRGGGCRDLSNQVPSADAAERAFLSGVSDNINDFFEALPQDPAFDELNREWATCLRDAGYQGTSPAAAESQASDDFIAVLEAAAGNLTAAMRAEHAPAEIALATADATCREAVDYTARHADIQWDLEQAYVDAHAADLEAYRQALAD